MHNLHLAVYDQIEINVPLAPHMFAYDPPDGYKATSRDKDDKNAFDPFVAVSARIGQFYFESRCSFIVDNLAILVCWHHHVERRRPEDPELRQLVPTVESANLAIKREWELHPRANQTIRGEIWHRALILARDRRPMDAGDSAQSKFAVPQGEMAILNITPLP